MALIEINLNPTQRQLKWFGVTMFVFFAFVGGLLKFIFNMTVGAYIIWGLASLMAIVYCAMPPIRASLYRGWLHAILPIGWTISHVLLAIIYFAVVTPIGWTLRLIYRDPLGLEWDSSVATYWFERVGSDDPPRYFKQY